MNDQEYERALRDKIYEKALELHHAVDWADQLSEMADVLEILKAFAKFWGFTWEEVEETAKKKREEHGGCVELGSGNGE